jgi:RHS repeat-associated protein
MTDENGAKIETTEYMPFGSLRSHWGTNTSDYRFTDQELDAENGLYNYNARLYDPVMSRFISPDTIIPDQYNPQALNRYAYCLNNPLKYTDPSGHIIWADPNVEHEMRGRGKGFNFSQLIALDPYYTFVLKPMIGEHSYMHYIDQQAKENTKKLDDFLSAFENIDFICEKSANCYGYQQVVKDE